MIKSSVEKLSDKAIGFEIGMSDDVTQANLLNSFCKGLTNSMDTYKLSTQLCYIADKLDNRSHTVIKKLAEFIKLKEK